MSKAFKMAARVAARHMTAGLSVGQTLEVGSVRMHRYNNSIHVWDLTNAGKRGKKVQELVIMSGSYAEEKQRLEGIGKLIDSYGSYSRILATLNDYLEDYPGAIKLEEYTRRGVDVTPGGFKALEIETKHVKITADYNDFSIKNLDDQFNEPTCIPAITGGKKSVPVFYRWVQDNESKIKRMSYPEILKEMGRLGIKYHSYCAMD